MAGEMRIDIQLLVDRLKEDAEQLRKMQGLAKFGGSETGVRVKDPALLLADLDEAVMALSARSPDESELKPVAWTGSGSLAAMAAGREAHIWPDKADAHPIPLYTHPAPRPSPDTEIEGLDDAGDALTLRSYIKEFGETPSMTASRAAIAEARLSDIQAKCGGCITPAEHTLEVERLRKLMAKLVMTATILHQNSVGCATNHHGHDIGWLGLPGWLADAEAVIVAAALSTQKGDHPDAPEKESKQ